MNANKIQRLALWDGSILLLFGFGVWVMQSFSFGWFSTISMSVGAGLVIFYIISKFGQLKEILTRRSLRYNINALVIGLVFLGIIVVANYIFYSHEVRWDVTEQKLYSLSEQTKTVAGKLQSELKIYVFATAGMVPFLDLLKSYTYISDNISYEVIDPDKHPEMAKKFDITQDGAVIMESGSQTMMVKNMTEEGLTNAIIKITKSSKKTVYLVEGHGERSIADKENIGGYQLFGEALQKENFTVRPLLLGSQEKVPTDASVVVIAAPQRDFMEHETMLLRNYLERGGSLMVSVEPIVELPLLFALLADYGITYGKDIVVDRVMRLFQGQGVDVNIIANGYDPGHPVTEKFNPPQNFRSVFPMVRTVSEAPGNSMYDVTELVFSSPNSWQEDDLVELMSSQSVEQAEDEKRGPLAIAVAVTRKGGANRSMKILAFGDADFLGNRSISNYFNTDLGMNAITWLAGQEDFISIRPPGPRISMVRLEQDQINIIFYLSVLLLPLILLLAGVNVWIWRR
jgi:gliding motility-associatede transport system auxiliary component